MYSVIIKLSGRMILIINARNVGSSVVQDWVDTFMVPSLIV